MNRLERVWWWPVAAVCVMWVATSGCNSPEPPAAGTQTVRRETTVGLMSTECSLIVYAESAGEAEAALRVGVETLELIASLLDRHDPESELSRVNAAAGDTEPVAVSLETNSAMFTAQGVLASTRGAFNPLVGPLVDVWKKAAKNDRLPEESTIAQALTLLDADAWKTDFSGETGSFAHLAKPGMRLDLGGMAKGYAADVAVVAMRNVEGVRGVLVNLGGDGVCWCDDAWDRPWTFGVQDPDGEPGRTLATIQLRSGAVVTSGHYYRSTTIAGRRFSHILDPRTGWPVEPSVVSVTVVHPSGAVADSLATAVAVLGPEAGLALLENRDGAEGILFVESDDRLKPLRTTGFSGVEPAPAAP